MLCQFPITGKQAKIENEKFQNYIRTKHPECNSGFMNEIEERSNTTFFQPHYISEFSEYFIRLTTVDDNYSSPFIKFFLQFISQHSEYTFICAQILLRYF